MKADATKNVSANLALNKSVKAFSSLGDSPETLLTDGQKDATAKFWSSRAFATFPDHRLYPEWIVVDLGKHYRIHAVHLFPRADGKNVGQGFPEDFTIQVSPEAEPWTTVVEKTGYAQPTSPDAQKFEFPPCLARFIKVESSRLRPVDGAHYFQLAEVEVFGSPGEAPGLSLPILPAKVTAPAVANLRCEYQVDPVGVDALQPRLSWVLEGNGRGQRQTAYRVLVAGSRAELDAHQGTLWDSGRIESDRSVGIEYGGKPLASGSLCFWKVMLWDKDAAPTAWSQPARFSMGKLQASDWRGRWIGASEDPQHAAVHLRTEFTVAKPVRRATVSFSGLGWSQLAINGERVNDWELSPGSTSYHIRTPYLVVDVTRHFAASGHFALGALLGDGWYALSKDPWVHKFETLPYVDKPKLLLDLELEFTDGGTQVVTSDESWKWSYGPIIQNWVSLEHLDLRQSMPGWDQPGYNDSAWKPVALVQGPAGKMACQKEPPTRVIQTLRPQALTHDPKSNRYRYDFGREFQGWVQFQTSGPAGTEVEILVHPPKCRAVGYNSGYSNRFILAGNGVEQYVPRFNYNAVTSIGIKGTTQPPTLDDLVGYQVNADLQTAGSFRCSDDTLNWLQEAVIRTYMNYVTGFPNDPTREKKGWPCDILYAFHPSAYLFDSQRLFDRWLTDIIDGQAPDGNCPNITPGPFFDEYNGIWFGGMGVWGPWQLYQIYGDLQVLVESYPAMKKYMEFLRRQTRDHMQDWGLPDWLAIEDSPPMLVSTPAYFLFAQIVSRVAAMQGLHEDEQTYAELAQSIKATFNRKFLEAGTGIYNLPDAKPIAGIGGAAGNSTLHHRVWWQPGGRVPTQGAQALALGLDLVPTEMRPLAEKSLLTEIEAHDGFISSGFVSTRYLLEVLADMAPEAGQKMAFQRAAPSWYAMTVDTDNDVMKETWSGGAALMPGLGCAVAFWNFSSLGGIRPDPSGPGFKKIIIKPNLVDNLHWVECHYDSVHGRIVSNWQRRGRQFTMDVTIPANTSATVHVPADHADEILENGKPLTQSAGILLLRTEAGRTVLACDAGVYRFTGNLPLLTKNTGE